LTPPSRQGDRSGRRDGMPENLGPLSAPSITRAIAISIIGRTVIYYPVLTSTMDEARKQARAGLPEGTVVIAEKQTAGRGRLKRTWFAPEGNIALSVVLYPRLADLPSLIMLSSLAVLHSIQTVTGIRGRIKWPNDVLVNGKKVCGILIETDVRRQKVNYAIVGIGINVNLSPADFPEIESSAASLSKELGKDVSRLGLVRALLAEMDRLYLTLKAGGSLYEEWRDNLDTLGKHVRATSVDGVQEGIAESADRDCSLCLRTTDGKLVRIMSGDVTLSL